MPRKAISKEYWREDYKRRKRKLIDKLGGKCNKCGSINELQIDHINPKEKSFNISALIRSSRLVGQEIHKCQILCFPCHKQKNKIDGSQNKNRVRGEKANFSKLTNEMVISIRAHVKNGFPIRKLARELKLDRGTIQAIIHRKTWTHI